MVNKLIEINTIQSLNEQSEEKNDNMKSMNDLIT